MAVSSRIAFLDRDGVINHDVAYIGRPEDFTLIDGVPQALRMLRDAGYQLVVVTNQSGIGRGYFTEDDYRRVTARMEELLGPEGVALAAIRHCPHRPDAGCDCRKPKPGMLIDTARQLGLSLEGSVLFGDKETDIAAGRAAGVTRCFLLGGTAASTRGEGEHALDLLAAVKLLLRAQRAAQR